VFCAYTTSPRKERNPKAETPAGGASGREGSRIPRTKTAPILTLIASSLEGRSPRQGHHFLRKKNQSNNKLSPATRTRATRKKIIRSTGVR
jgi:hypothetical protein